MPVEALAFLGAVLAFLVILVIFFLYLNKKLCFSECGGFPCIDKPLDTKEEKANRLDTDTTQPIITARGRKQYGSAYSCDDQDTSSDSDDEVLRRYQQSIQRVPSQRSLHSNRSHKSTTSKTGVAQNGYHGNKTDGEPLMSDDGYEAQTGRHDDVAEGRHADRQVGGEDATSSHGVALSARSVQSGRSGAAPGGQVTTAPSPAAAQSQVVYENSAFDQDQDLSPGQPSPGQPSLGQPSLGQPSPTSTEQALSNYGDGSVSLGDEHLFDVSDLQDREPVLISKCGNLEVTFDYDLANGRMNITIHRAQDIPSKDRGGANNTQIRLLLLPTKKIKHKTKVKVGENPEFMETFSLKVAHEEVGSMGVRFRLYGCERMRRERMIGEVIVGFASLNLEMSTTHNLTLEPRSNLCHGDSKLDVSSLSRSDSASSTQSMQHGGMPELLIGLTYNGTTGRLSVEAIKGSNFKNMAMNRAPDTYVKLTLMSPNGQEIARSKTSIRRGQPNPLYKETFMFQVALFQLPDVTLMVSVYNKRSMKRKEMIGWFSLGYSSSGEEEVSHWNDMRESKGEAVCRWHVLLEA